jgi:Ser/Thr protein kinase RdoA (MazF antagonist)
MQDAVEAEFYRTYALRLPDSVRVPALLAAEDRGGGGERYLLLEDLDAAGYPCRRLASDSDQRDVGACVAWLARFHAAFLSRGASSPAPGLWSVGCYWHLATRPDELAAMPDSALKRAAHAIDARLAACRWATVLHGDAKLANFCFPAGGGGQRRDVAAVDFQYCGGGYVNALPSPLLSTRAVRLVRARH